MNGFPQLIRPYLRDILWFAFGAVIYLGVLWGTFKQGATGFALLASYMVTVMVSTRLSATRRYSFAFVAPDYRRRQLALAVGILALLAWLPSVTAGALFSDPVGTVAIQLFVTGFVLCGEYRYRRIYAASSMAVFALLLVLMFLHIRPSLEPGPVASTMLILTGVVLNVHFIRIYLRGDEYAATFESSIWTGGMQNSSWVKDYTTLTNEAQVNLIHIQRIGGLRKLSRTIESHLGSGSSKTLRAMIDLGSGDWMQWQNMRYITLWFGLVILVLMVLFVPAEKQFDAIPKVLLALIFGLQVCMSVGYASTHRWPLSYLWMRTGITDKAELRRLFWRNKYGHVVLNYLLACAAAVAVLGIAELLANVFPQQERPVTPAGSALFSSQKLLITAGAWSLAITLGGIGIGLILDYFRIPLALAILIGIAVGSAWVLLLIWIHDPLPDNLAPFTAMLLTSSLVCFIPVALWRYRRFYEHLDHAISA